MANGIYNYGQGYPLRNDFNYTGEDDWFNNVNEPPMGLGNLQQSRRLMDPTMMMGQLGNKQPLNTLDRGWQHQLELQKRPAYQAPEKTGIAQTIKGWTTVLLCHS